MIELETDPKTQIADILAGYKNDTEAVAGAALSEATDMESAADIVTESLKEFLRVEKIIITHSFCSLAMNSRFRRR
jgi:hypothetical protein